MKLQKEKLIGKYNIAFGFFIVAILGILIYNFVSLDIFNLKHPQKATKLYFADNISDAHRKIIELFNQKYEGKIEVVPINLPFTKFTTNERKELLARSLRSDNSLVDIFSVDQIWVPRFAKWAEPLEQDFQQEELDRILAPVLKTCYCEENLVSIPLYLDVGVLFYRKDILKEKIPNWQTFEKKIKNSIEWSELITVSQQHFPGEFTYVYQGKDFEGLICNYAEILGSMGGQLSFLDKDKIQDLQHVAATQFLHDLVHNHKISPPEVTNFVEVSSYRYAKDHDIPFLRGWFSSWRDSMAFGAGSAYLENLELAMMPHFDGHPHCSVFGGWNLMLKKNSEKKEAALKFFRFILSDEVQEILYKEAKFLFVVNNLYEKKELLAELGDFDLKEIINNHGVYRPTLENYTKISDIYSHYLSQAISGNIKATVAMEQIANTIFSDQFFIK